MTNLGRLLLCFLLVAVAFAQTAQQLPTTEGESLTGSKVVLPEAAKGKVSVLIFGFTKASKKDTSAWADRISSDFGSQSAFALYQLPVLESVPGFVRGMVISSMKKGVREDMRDHFVPILHGEANLKKLVSYKEPDDAYMLLLDPSGQIVEQKHGPFTETAYGPLRADIQSRLTVRSK